jgi:hypothetical protein
MRGTPISEAEFGRMLSNWRSTAFRYETRDHYALDYEEADYQDFLVGQPTPPPEVAWWRPWLDQIADLTAQGRRMSRVRLLAEPPSAYQRWELWAAPWQAKAGEDIRYMSRSTAVRLGLPDGPDWWLLDDQRLIIMEFTVDGEIAGKLLVTDPDEIARHQEWRDLAVRHAIPAARYSAA